MGQLCLTIQACNRHTDGVTPTGWRVGRVTGAFNGPAMTSVFEVLKAAAPPPAPDASGFIGWGQNLLKQFVMANAGVHTLSISVPGRPLCDIDFPPDMTGGSLPVPRACAV